MVESIKYTGIGSRVTPEGVLNLMREFGRTLPQIGLVLRSGHADGADMAFEYGCDLAIKEDPSVKKEIYLPWKGFNGSPSKLYDVPRAAIEYAADVYGPAWQFVSHATRLFMGRNIQQVLGKNLDEQSAFVLCWTPDGCRSAAERKKKTGGTGQAIACASELNIPVFNLQIEGENYRFLRFLDEELFNVEK